MVRPFPLFILAILNAQAVLAVLVTWMWITPTSPERAEFFVKTTDRKSVQQIHYTSPEGHGLPTMEIRYVHSYLFSRYTYELNKWEFIVK